MSRGGNARPGPHPAAASPQAEERIDKWLWQARFFKTRSLAATVVSQGHVRVNGQPVSRPSRAIRAGDVLTFMQAARVRVVTVLSVAERRGPASEARLLYADADDQGGPGNLTQPAAQPLVPPALE